MKESRRLELSIQAELENNIGKLIQTINNLLKKISDLDLIYMLIKLPNINIFFSSSELVALLSHSVLTVVT